jgi:hypothetical protein
VDAIERVVAGSQIENAGHEPAESVNDTQAHSCRRTSAPFAAARSGRPVDEACAAEIDDRAGAEIEYRRRLAPKEPHGRKIVLNGQSHPPWT